MNYKLSIDHRGVMFINSTHWDVHSKELLSVSPSFPVGSFSNGGPRRIVDWLYCITYVGYYRDYLVI